MKEIQNIEFGILSTEEILDMSVAEIKNNRITGTNVVGSLYDPRMGPMNNNDICPTCSMKPDMCPGHFGHIVLNIDIIHPLFYRTVLSFLKCVCIQCSKLLITKDHLILWDYLRFKGEIRFNMILDKLEKVKYCMHCNISQPKYTLSLQDGVFISSYKTAKKVDKIILTQTEIAVILRNISNEDVELLGFNATRTHPKHLILSVLPVLPPRSRPYIITDGTLCDDDLTLAYAEIIKINNNLDARLNELTENKRIKNIQTLVFRIKTMFDNSQSKARHTNSRAMKGIKERLCGKDGIIRNNLLGKRVDFSARTVIGPDPSLRFNEIAVPEEIADNLSFPEHVNDHNIETLQQLVWKDGANTVDRGDVTFILKYALMGERRYKFKLRLGDIVHRKLRDGDIVLLNRQPSLHKGSTLAKKIIRRPGKTIRLSLATTSSFNADFDGDEMNLFPPESEMSRAELEILAATQHNMIGAQASKPIVCIVQDGLLASYLMTQKNEPISKEEFYQLCMQCDNLDFDTIQRKLDSAKRVYQKFNKNIPLYCGKTLFSMLLPDDFMYAVKTNASLEEPMVRVYKGILYEGGVTKVCLGKGHSSMIFHLQKEYSNAECINFINNVQFLGNAFLLYHGFSIGIGDCLSTKTDEIDSVVTRCFMEAEGIEQVSNHNPLICEARVNMTLGKAKDVGMRIAKESLRSENNFIATVTSGSKGDFFNIAQIMGLLGQQNVTGKRVQPQLTKRTRALPHYPFQMTNKAQEYEAKGFVRSSFIKGLNPMEFWVHAATGRESMTDTVLKTGTSGYIQRKMVKIMEDVQVKYDQTVRNSVGSIIQFAYGDDNLCGTETVLVNGKPTSCDVKRLVERLNAQHELEHGII